MVFRWPNRCWYGDWVVGLVVLVLVGMGWAVDCWFVGGLVFSGFFFFFPVLLVVSALVGCV